MSYAVLCLLALIVLCFPTSVRAWGRQGHQTVAVVAEGLMRPETLRWVEAVRRAPGWRGLEPGDSVYMRSADEDLIRFCRGPQADLSLVSDWADAWRERHPATGPWHFVDIPLDSDDPEGAVEAACAGDCILTQLERSLAALRDPAAGPDARLEALLWVVHLVGDIHQPLHCSDNHDRGGNAVRVWVGGRGESLHSAWDTGFFKEERARPEVLAAELLTHECGEVAAVGPLGPAAFQAWALESFGVARDFVYPQERRNGGEFSRGEVDAAWPVLRVQLARAGVRLAAVLDSAAASGAAGGR